MHLFSAKIIARKDMIFNLVCLGPDMKFVKKITLPDFQDKNFTPSISPNFNSFGEKNVKKLTH